MSEAKPPQEILAKKLIINWLVAYFFSFLIGPLWYFSRILLSRSVSVEEYWFFFSLLSLVTLFSVYNDLWLTESLQYFLPQYRAKTDHKSANSLLFFTAILQFISALIFWSVIFFTSDRLAQNYFHFTHGSEIITLFAWYFLGINFIQLFSSAFYAFQNVLYANLIEFVRVLSITLFTLFLFSSGSLTLLSYTFCWLGWLALAIITGFTLYFTGYLKETKAGIFFSKSIIKKWLSYGLWVFLWVNFLAVSGHIDQQIVIYFLGPTQSWYYANFLNLITIYVFVVFPILNFLPAISADLIVQKNFDKLKILLSILYKYFSVFSMTIGLFYLCFWPEIAALFFWKAYFYSGYLLQFIWPFIVFNTLHSINYYLMNGFWLAKQRTLIVIIWVVSNILITISTLSRLGILAVIVGTITGWLVTFFMSLHSVYRFQTFSFDRTFFFKNVFILVILWGIFSYSKSFFFSLCQWFRPELWLLMGYGIVTFLLLFIINWSSVKLLYWELKYFRAVK